MRKATITLDILVCFCDDLEGPFVAGTDLLKSFKFSEKYRKEILFVEFFLRVSRAGNFNNELSRCNVLYY